MDARREEWKARLPDWIDSLSREWSLTIGPPFAGPEVSCAWVAPVRQADGTHAVLKLGMPHMEAEQEIEGLRFWAGEPTVRLLAADTEKNAMLLERCEPGTHLRALPELEQDEIIASLLRRLWRRTPEPRRFRPLAVMCDFWAESTRAASAAWPDPGLVEEGLQLWRALPRTAPREALLATDLHAGNVLRARRERWLVIDPKPFYGDVAYDATQHLWNCLQRLRADPGGLIRRLADLLQVDSERVRLWMFARAAAEPRDNWNDPVRLTLARSLAP